MSIYIYIDYLYIIQPVAAYNGNFGLFMNLDTGLPAFANLRAVNDIIDYLIFI